MISSSIHVTCSQMCITRNRILLVGVRCEFYDFQRENLALNRNTLTSSNEGFTLRVGFASKQRQRAISLMFRSSIWTFIMYICKTRSYERRELNARNVKLIAIIIHLCVRFES